MKLFLLCCFLVYAVARGQTAEHHVTIREVSQTSQLASPDDLHVQFTLNGRAVTLRLKRNAKIDVNAPVTFEDGKDPRGKSKKKQNVQLYQDVKNFATISTKSVLRNGAFKREMHGSFEHGNGHFSLEPIRGGSHGNHDHVVRKIKVKRVKGKKGIYPMVPEFIRKDRKPERERTLDRKKRSTSVQDYHVEIMMVLDYTVWEEFMEKTSNDEDLAISEIQYHFSHILNGMDLVYSGIEASLHGFTVSLWLKGFHIAKTASSSTWSNGFVLLSGSTPETTIVNPSGVLYNMKTWSKQDGRDWNNPDHYMLWTRNDLNGATIGIAYIGGICAGAAVSVVEYRDFHGWQVPAHELGHNLGAPHDNSTECPDAGGNVMMPSVGSTETVEKASSAYTLSSCSIQYMKQTLEGTLDGYPRLCLTDNACDHTSTTLQQLPGEKHSLDEQCRLRRDDQTSAACNAGQENICRELRCAAQSGQCWSYYRLFPGAADGSPCGDGKWCMQAQCVTKSSSPSEPCVPNALDTSLPSGCMDHSWFKLRFTSGEEYSCNEIPSNMPSFCYQDPDIARFCCGSCRGAGIQYSTDLASVSCTDWTSGLFYYSDGQLNTCAGFAATGYCPGLYYACCASCAITP